MQYKSYNKIIIWLLVITLVTLSACSNESQDLFKEKTDASVITDSATTQSPVVTSSTSDKMNVDEQGEDLQDQNKQNQHIQNKDIDNTITQKDNKSTDADIYNSDNTQTMGDSMELKGKDQTKEFYYEELSDAVKKRIYGKSYKENCDVPYEDLRYVSVLYWGFDEQTHKGELIVNKDIAQDIVEIFSELYDIKYPIERMVLVDDYDADDNTSMAADNTSSFNYRNVDGTEHLSLHSYGLAIDINPLYNPYVRTINNKTSVLPKEGTEYSDRTKACSYYINEKDSCYRIFIEHGFTWGGDWKKTKDYQHFEKKLK